MIETDCQFAMLYNPEARITEYDVTVEQIIDTIFKVVRNDSSTT